MGFLLFSKFFPIPPSLPLLLLSTDISLYKYSYVSVKQVPSPCPLKAGSNLLCQVSEDQDTLYRMRDTQDENGIYKLTIRQDRCSE